MTQKAIVTWKSNMAFDAEINGHKLIMDTDSAGGGDNLGPRPKILLLAGLGGCTGMDVISILAKMKIVPDNFWMEISAELCEDHPKVFNAIKLVYCFKGANLPFENLEKAVNLSKEKYCAVSAMLSKTAKIESQIKVVE